MFIHEAIKARTADKPYIVRELWLDELGPWAGKAAKILPTRSPDLCVIMMAHSKKDPCRGWQPSAEDLLADDWTIIS